MDQIVQDFVKEALRDIHELSGPITRAKVKRLQEALNV